MEITNKIKYLSISKKLNSYLKIYIYCLNGYLMDDININHKHKYLIR